MTAIVRLCALLLATCLSGTLAVAPAAARTVRHAALQGVTQPAATPAMATLTQCVTTGPESERSLTVAAQMTIIPAASRMQMRTYLVQRRGDEAQFHMIAAPGLGSWLEAEPGVKTYKDLRQVTNLSAPAVYRAVVDFRWMSSRGHVIKRLQLNTARCVQPAPLPSSGSTAAPVGPSPTQSPA